MLFKGENNDSDSWPLWWVVRIIFENYYIGRSA